MGNGGNATSRDPEVSLLGVITAAHTHHASSNRFMNLLMSIISRDQRALDDMEQVM